MTDIELKHKQLEFLNDTINHYNSNNRSISGDYDKCTYFPINPDSEGCAIGRMIKDKDLCKRLDGYCSNVLSSHIFSELPEDLQELGQNFLYNVQMLHDTHKYWDENGLNEEGKGYVSEIDKRFNLV